MGLRVLFLQDHFSLGGAAVAAQRYAASLRALGPEVETACGDGAVGPKTFLLTGKPPRGLGRLGELILPHPVRTDQRRRRVLKQWAQLLEQRKPDLVWAHNLHGAEKWGWHADLLQAALAQGPVLWTLHDMWALGEGRPYFPEREVGRQIGGGNLAKIMTSPHRRRFRCTAPSRWLAGLVNESFPRGCAVWEYPPPPGSSWPEARRQETRASLGLRDDEILVVAAAENLADERKGMRLLLEAWTQLARSPRQSPCQLALFGRGHRSLGSLPPSIRTFPATPGPAKLAEFFAAADLFVHPAQMDNQPLVIQEAHAAGLPVLAFAVGGVSEMIREGETGWLVSEVNPDSLGRALQRVLGEPRGLLECRRLLREKPEAPPAFASRWREIAEPLVAVGGS